MQAASIWGGIIVLIGVLVVAWRAAIRWLSSSPPRASAAPSTCGYCHRSLKDLRAPEAFAHLAACAAGGDGGVHVESETSIESTTSESSETTERHWTETFDRCPSGRPRCKGPARRHLCSLAGLAILSVFGCKTPDPAPTSAPTTTTTPPVDWRARAEAIVEAHWPDVEQIRGLILVEYCRITNPIGDFAGLSDAERRAAIIALADGWEAASKRKATR